MKSGVVFLTFREMFRSIPKALRTENPQRQDAILKHLRENSGATFGAALYRDFVRFGAFLCNVENESILFLNGGLFDVVRGRARQFERPQIALKIRRPQGRGGSIPPPGTNRINSL